MSFWPTSGTRCQINNYLINRMKDRRKAGADSPKSQVPFDCVEEDSVTSLLTSSLSMGLKPKS